MDTSLSPGFVRITYTGITGVHHAIVPTNFAGVPTPGVEPDLDPLGGVAVGAVEAVTTYITAWGAGLGGSQLIGLVEIYAVDVYSGEGTFIYGFDADTAGSGAGDGIGLSQATLSTKLVNGRTGKVVWMDGIMPVNTKLFPPFSPGYFLDVMADYLISSDSIFYGRGNAYPFGVISATAKTSDVSRKRKGLS